MGSFAPAEIRLWRSVSKPIEGCWECKLTRSKNGYSKINVDGKMRLAHRVAYESAHGLIPEGLEVCRTCDNRACCRPSHLEVGTHAKNLADAYARGGFVRDERGRYIKTWSAA